jgi:hypothetical protein
VPKVRWQWALHVRSDSLTECLPAGLLQYHVYRYLPLVIGFCFCPVALSCAQSIYIHLIHPDLETLTLSRPSVYLGLRGGRSPEVLTRRKRKGHSWEVVKREKTLGKKSFEKGSPEGRIAGGRDLSYQCFSRSIKPYVQSIFTIHSPVSDVTSQTRLVATDGSFDAAESPELATDKDCVRYRTSHSEGVTHAYYVAITLPSSLR